VLLRSAAAKDKPEVMRSVTLKVTLRLMVYRQSVRLGAKPFETHDQRLLLLLLLLLLIIIIIIIIIM
jgi:hypothetical protein